MMANGDARMMTVSETARAGADGTGWQGLDRQRTVLGLAAAYRHMALNYLQVLGGWLHMGRPGHAAEHAAVFRDVLLAETRLVRAARPEAATVLLLCRVWAEDHGIELRFQAEDGVRDFGWPAAVPDDLVAATVEAAVTALDRHHTGEVVTVALAEAEGRRLLRVRLEAPGVPCSLLTEALEERLAARGVAGGARATLAGLAAGGGRWECRQGDEGALVELSWPRRA